MISCLFYIELTGKLILGERLDGNQSSISKELREVGRLHQSRGFLLEKIELEATFYYLHEFQREAREEPSELLFVHFSDGSIIGRGTGGKDASSFAHGEIYIKIKFRYFKGW